MTASTEKFRILIADDHPIVREGLSELLNRQEDLLCCATVGRMNEVQGAIEKHRPHLILLDLRFGTTDGLELIKTLRSQFPDLRILVLSQLDEGTYAERVLRAGALGYVMKEQATDEVLNAIRKVLAGELYVSSKVMMMTFQRLLRDKPAIGRIGLELLTDRELYVLHAVGQGKSNKEIAGELNLSFKTVETYREHIKHKLGLASGAELLRYAKQTSSQNGPMP